MIVVDTSVLIDYLRGRSTPAAQVLDRLEDEGVPFAIPGVCCQELLQGAATSRDWSRLLVYLESQTVVHPADPWRTHVEAARIFFDCRRRGLTVRGSTDCLIAQMALDANAVLLHDDDDFDRIASIRPLRCIRRP